ncbi:MAG: DUF3370 domain-containing protein [Gloeomargarita sp. SKYG116]|nr:DUF3370 domain-containing protein [Gloeomargarita sp. SKYG116]MDW8400287.1 DUF3370 domain-containing protein [Gloeomargarita sp. SKYGB_i_bin116]
MVPWLAQVTPTPPAVVRRLVFNPQPVRPLPGQLDDVPMFNSNSPEVVQQEGILLSTLPPDGKRVPQAHLNLPLQGEFTLFAHHIFRTNHPETTPTLFLGLILYNPTKQFVQVNISQAASFLSTPEAPFVDLPSYVDNGRGYIYSGPGSRTMNAVLRGIRQRNWPAQVALGPGEYRLLANLPIPAPRLSRTVTPRVPVPAELTLTQGMIAALQNPLLAQADGDVWPEPPSYPSSNGRSTFARLRSDGPVHVASLAMFAPRTWDGRELAPTMQDWVQLLTNGGLAGPRDIPPTPLHATQAARFFYGRVAGVAKGSRWSARLTDEAAGLPAPQPDVLTIPPPGQAFSYGLSTLHRGTFGTGQIQSAPLLVRYPDTAFMAHGNYGVHYELQLPLYNASNFPQTVAISIQCPLKDDAPRGGLQFLEPPEPRIFFRGTIRLRFPGEDGTPQIRYVHVVKQRGQQGEPLVTLNLAPKEQRLVEVDYLYPPDATPPQVLTVQTLAPQVTQLR